MKIEGIPDGWELVRIGAVKAGEWALSEYGVPWRSLGDGKQQNFVIIRRIPPPLNIPPKVFADGWVFYKDGMTWWQASKPIFENGQFQLKSAYAVNWVAVPCLVFDALLKESQGICRVTWEHGSECEQT